MCQRSFRDFQGFDWNSLTIRRPFELYTSIVNNNASPYSLQFQELNDSEIVKEAKKLLGIYALEICLDQRDAANNGTYDKILLDGNGFKLQFTDTWNDQITEPLTEFNYTKDLPPPSILREHLKFTLDDACTIANILQVRDPLAVNPLARALQIERLKEWVDLSMKSHCKYEEVLFLINLENCVPRFTQALQKALSIFDPSHIDSQFLKTWQFRFAQLLHVNPTLSISDVKCPHVQRMYRWLLERNLQPLIEYIEIGNLFEGKLVPALRVKVPATVF